MKIAICDDEKKASEALLEILRECPESVEKTDVYFSGEELLRAKEQYDLLFLDIDMEGIDGIETARKIRLKDKKVKIVYVTAYSEYAGKAFSVHAFGYLLKPVKKEKVLRQVEDALAYKEEEQELSPVLEFETSQGRTRLHTADIYYFEIRGRQIKLAAIGTGTDRELQNHGLRADLIPEVYDGEHLGKALCEQNPSGKVLILRAKMGTPALTQELDKNEIVYNDVRCYDTEYIHYDPEQVKELLTPGSVAAFTSASTVKGFVAAMGAETDYSGITAACIGVQTEAEAKKYGFDTITAKKATIEALIQTIVEGE